MAWMPRRGETVVPYDPIQRGLYEAGRPSQYDPWAWPPNLLVGRNNRRNRCFPEVAARDYFEGRGYKVLLSAPKYPDDLGFILFHYAGMRKKGHAAFVRMQGHFPAVDLNKLAEYAQRAKKTAGLRGSGGDPDLFVFKGRSRFFVEVKDQDPIHANQLVCFPIIEKRLGCLVKLVRITPRCSGTRGRGR